MEDEKVNQPEAPEATPPPPATEPAPAGVADAPAAPSAEAAPAATDASSEAFPPVSEEVAAPAPAAADLPVDDTTIVATPGAEVAAAAAAPAAAGATAGATAATTARPAPARAPLDRTGRGGTASILAGVAIIAPVLIRELTRGSDPYLLLPVSLILLAVALGGLRVAQAGRDGNLGRVGFLLASVGALVLVLMLLVIAYNDMVLNTRLQSGGSLLDLGFYALVIGLVLFGLSSLQAGVIARGPMLLMLIAVPLGLVLDAVGAFEGNRRFIWGPGLTIGAGVHLGLKVMGLALIWVGYSILKTTKAKASNVAARA